MAGFFTAPSKEEVQRALHEYLQGEAVRAYVIGMSSAGRTALVATDFGVFAVRIKMFSVTGTALLGALPLGTVQASRSATGIRVGEWEVKLGLADAGRAKELVEVVNQGAAQGRADMTASPAHDPGPPAATDPHAELRSLRAGARTEWESPEDLLALPYELRRLADLLLALGLAPDSTVVAALRHAATYPLDADAVFRAGFELVEVGLDDLAVAPLAQAFGLIPGVDRLMELTVALEGAHRPDQVVAAIQANPWALEHDSCRVILAHNHSMLGDLRSAREQLSQVGDPGDLRRLHDLVLVRGARHDALANVDRDQVGALRWWEAVLNGCVVLEVSDLDEEAMGGRYGALWDQAEQVARSLVALREVLDAVARTPRAVLCAPDRDSTVLGWAISSYLGLPAPVELSADRSPPVGSLVVAYDWSSMDPALAQATALAADSVLFGHSLRWTADGQVTPDVAFLEAQAIFAPWSGDRLRLVEDESGRRSTESLPPDPREAHVIGREVAALAAAAESTGASAVRSIIGALSWAGADIGLLTGSRHRYYSDIPVTSGRFL